MATVLVTGANRGLGLEFARQYASDGWEVLATARNPQKSKELSKLAEKYPKTQVIRLDVSDPKSIEELRKKVDKPVDVLILNAGVYPRDGQKVGEIDYRGWRDALETNVFGPMRVVEVLLKNVQASRRKQIAAVSSSMASLGGVAQGDSVSEAGTSYQYRSSKTALNMAMAILAKELAPRGISVVLLDPGWVKTDMGGGRAPLTPEQSIRGMRRVLAGDPKATAGKFMVHDGSEMHW